VHLKHWQSQWDPTKPAARGELIFAGLARAAKVRGMTKLLFFWGAIYYVALAAIFAVAWIDRRRMASLQKTEPTQDERREKAA
jgi:hypothetical protein